MFGFPTPLESGLLQPQVLLVEPGETCRGDSDGPTIFSPEKWMAGGVTPDGAFELRDVPPGAYIVCFKSGESYMEYTNVGQVAIERNTVGLTFPVR